MNIPQFYHFSELSVLNELAQTCAILDSGHCHFSKSSLFDVKNANHSWSGSLINWLKQCLTTLASSLESRHRAATDRLLASMDV